MNSSIVPQFFGLDKNLIPTYWSKSPDENQYETKSDLNGFGIHLYQGPWQLMITMFQTQFKAAQKQWRLKFTQYGNSDNR